MMTIDSQSPPSSAFSMVAAPIAPITPVAPVTRAHPETMKDLDPSRVEDASDTFSVSLDTTTKIRATMETPVMRGLPKHVRGGTAVYASPSGDTVLGEYGQDHVLSHKLTGVLQEKLFSAHVLACADGHGMWGKEVSRLVMDYLVEHLTPARLQEVLECVCARQETQVRQCLDAFYTEMDATTTAHVHEGTTLSLLFVVEYDGRVFVVASNVGDSPVLLVDNETGKVTRLHAEHNWDSVKERRVQLQASREAGRDDAVVIYSRFNCENGTPFRDHRGGRDVIPMFREGTDELQEETREHIMLMSKVRNCVGGTQSLRKMKTLCWNATTEEWEEEALEEFGHDNFGSTPLIMGPDTDDNGDLIKHGGCQMTRGLGDHAYKGAASGPHVPLVFCKPSVTVKELLASGGKDWSLVVCSDGIGDAFYWHQVGDVFKEAYKATMSQATTSEEATSALFRQTMRNGRRVFRLPSTVTAWDDLSMVVGRVKLEGEREL